MKEEIQLIYNSSHTTDREAYANLSALDNYALNEFDIDKNTMTPRQLAELVDEMNCDLHDLIVDYEDYAATLKGLSDNDLLSTINKNMDLLKTPIVRYKGKAALMKTPYDAYPIGLEIKSGH
ncbi:MAG: hypothetical protein AAF843_01590 [Bacteroidota bacterium]